MYTSNHNIKVVYLSITFLALLSCMNPNHGSQGKDFTNKIDNLTIGVANDSVLLSFFEQTRQPIPLAFEQLPTGSNVPMRWLLEIMREDLNHGIVGALDDLYPGIKADDLYHTSRRGGIEDIPEMGDLMLTGAAWETSIMWWNAETIGNWWDGFIRHAFLTEDEVAKHQSKMIVENLLASQDDDGYIGIYKKNLRYQHLGSNGELWAQTTAFRALLAYYELTQDQRILVAVEKAMALTMSKYSSQTRDPFDLKNAFGGVTHGLMLTDVCETLFRITRNKAYHDYAVFLYKAFSTYNINRAFNDIRYPFLIKKEEPFTGHGVHTYEHLRALLNAYCITGYDELKEAYENAMNKLDRCLLPSGAGHAMEWINGLTADPDNTATEFCSMLELRNFFGLAALKTGEVSFADHAEKLTFNAILGARNEDGTAITYGKPDNCYKLDGRSLDGEEMEVRYKYSPTHSEPAVCCAPNYTRNFTYYLDHMWGRAKDGFAAILYGPSMLNTEINGKPIQIEQITDYPYSDQIELRVTVTEPVGFKLYFRKPAWVKNMIFKGGKARLINDFYQIEKDWKTSDSIRIQFEFEAEAKEFRPGEIYFQRGPLVYALPIPYIRENIKDYKLERFHDYHCFAQSQDYKELAVEKSMLNFKFSKDENLNIHGRMVHQETGMKNDVQLIPMGKTVLRRVTFPVLE